jgi:hypothetical protein
MRLFDRLNQKTFAAAGMDPQPWVYSR